MANSAPSGMSAAGLLLAAGEGSPGGPRRRTRPLRCTALLREEHAVVLRMLGCLERAADAIHVGGPVCEGAFVKIFRLMNVFVCRGHYAKERRLLKVLETRGLLPPAGLLDEHRDSLDFAAAMLRSLPGAARGVRPARRMLAENATACVGFMRAHIAREERLVFSAADKVLTKLDDAAAVGAYAQVDHRTGSPLGGALADDIERSLAGIPGGVEEGSRNTGG